MDELIRQALEEVRRAQLLGRPDAIMSNPIEAFAGLSEALQRAEAKLLEALEADERPSRVP